VIGSPTTAQRHCSRSQADLATSVPCTVISLGLRQQKSLQAYAPLYLLRTLWHPYKPGDKLTICRSLPTRPMAPRYFQGPTHTVPRTFHASLFYGRPTVPLQQFHLTAFGLWQYLVRYSFLVLYTILYNRPAKL